MHTCIHTNTHTYTHTYLHISIQTHVYMYTTHLEHYPFNKDFDGCKRNQRVVPLLNFMKIFNFLTKSEIQKPPVLKANLTVIGHQQEIPGKEDLPWVHIVPKSLALPDFLVLPPKVFLLNSIISEFILLVLHWASWFFKNSFWSDKLESF